MCLLVLCSSMTGVMTKAEAANPAVAIEAMSLIVWVLGLLGITFATTGAQSQAAEEAYNDIPELKLWVDNNTQQVNPTTQQFILKKNALAELATTVIAKVKAYFSNPNNEIHVDDLTYYDYNNVKVLNTPSGAQIDYRNLPYNSESVISVIVASTKYEYKYEEANYGYIAHMINCNGQKVIQSQITETYNRSTYEVDTHWGFVLNVWNGVKYLRPVCTYRLKNKSTGEYIYPKLEIKYFGNVSYLGWLTLDRENFGTKPVNYYPLISYDESELNQALKQKAASMTDTDTISIPLDDPNWDATHGKTEVENPDTAVPAVPTTNWAEIWDLLGIKELIKTLTQNKPVTIEESDFKAPQLPTSIIDKFPFCVPFDLIAIVQTLNATPVAPSFTIPMRFDAINYTENFTIDLSGNDWNRVGKVIRWGNTLLFLAGLILITRKVIQA